MMRVLALSRKALSGLLVGAACVLGLAACSTTGSSFDASGLRFIVPGETTLEQASRLLKSDPTNTYRQLDGSAMARWSHKASVLTDAIYFNQELWLEFGPDGRFQKVQKSVNLPLANTHDAGARINTQPPVAHTSISVASPTPVEAASVGSPAPSSAATPANGTPAAAANSASTSSIMYKPAVSYPLPQ